MNESDVDILQAMVEYYRNKCNKLEYDFILHKAQSQKIINGLATKLTDASIDQGSGNGSRKKNESAGTN